MDSNMILPKKLIKKCPICGQEYNHSKVRILETQDLYILSYLKCSNCETGLVLKILMLPHGLVGQAVVTDLDDEEVMNFKKTKKPIQGADVLFVYDFFKNKEDLIKSLKS